jgi:restriction system protein
MAMPKFYETFLPILKVLENETIVKTSELPDMIIAAKYFTLSPEELTQTKESGGSLFRDRVAWGKTYLKQGKYLEQPGRGLVKISNKGKTLLESGITEFSLADLKKDPDYLEHEPESRPSNTDQLTNTYSPQDLVDTGIKELSKNLRTELKERLESIDPYYFQEVILVLFKKMGYGDFESTPKSGDGGIDGIINQDQLGIERIYMQAKRYKEGNKVREPEIRNFIGAMSGDVRKGIFVTTATFDDQAITKALSDRNHTLILIDGNKLVDLMIKFNVGVQIKETYEVKELDEDFFELN